MTFSFPLILLLSLGFGQDYPAHSLVSHGGITRMDTTQRTVYLVFTGHEFAEGGEHIASILGEWKIRASFFFTGDFYRNPANAPIIRKLVAGGHYLGPHSDKHLLYASWENRESLLVSKGEFEKDLLDNYSAMRPFGLSRNTSTFFMPPYEWYNSAISRWAGELGVTVVNFTPGTSSNADYTTPDMGSRYLSSDSILHRIRRTHLLSPSGLNGFLLLIHVGTDPRRADKLYLRLSELILYLHSQGYRFRRLY